MKDFIKTFACVAAYGACFIVGAGAASIACTEVEDALVKRRDKKHAASLAKAAPVAPIKTTKTAKAA